MLVNETLFGVEDKVKIAIDRIRNFEPPEGYYVAFSGGKDSVTILQLVKMAGVKYDAHYNLTTVDPPELVRFIKKEHPEVIIERPEKTMWQLIFDNGIPTRKIRFCCRFLKERGGEGRFCITGVRWEESIRRRNQRNVVELNIRTKEEIMLNNDNDENRRLVESCTIKSKHVLNPIVDWSDDDVWSFIRDYKVKYCSLYDEGFDRLGCIGCPMARTEGRLKEFERWPKFYQSYSRAINRWLERKHAKGQNLQWENAREVMDWWIYENDSHDPNQAALFDEA